MFIQFSHLLFAIGQEDKRIIQLLCSAFQHNERMHSLIGKGRLQFAKSLQVLITYCYFMVKKVGGIYRSKDKNVILLYYRKSLQYFSWRDGLRYLYLAFGVIGLRRLGKVYLREKRIRETRKKEIVRLGDVDFLYVWFLAQVQHGAAAKQSHPLESLLEAKQFIIRKAQQSDLPIYMETTEERLVRIYKRIGFEFYDYITDASEGIEVWFGRYEPKDRLTSELFLRRLNVGIEKLKTS